MARFPRAPRLVIDVSQEIITDSTERDSSHCMIAEAVKCAVPDATHVSVDLQTVRFSDPKKGLRYTYLTPRLGQVALIDFDQGEKPEPFRMRLSQGQVTPMGKKGRPVRPSSDAQLSQRQAASDKGREKMSEALRKSGLRQEEDAGSVPTKVGGRTPPTTPFARRRSFGLRALAR